MCFTININIVREEMERRFGAFFAEPRRYEPAYYQNAFTLPELPVIPMYDPEHIHLYRWGLIPFWVRDAQAAARLRTATFNARAETVTEKPAFREPVKKKRCLVPVRGFYEWQDRNGRKIPWYIYLRDHRPFALAGISDTWIHPVTGEENHTFSIITTRANPMMERIHHPKHRMPVILPEDAENRWLDTSLSVKELHELLQPFPEAGMKAHTISGLINRRDADRNVPEIIRPYSWEESRGLFG
ncbi:MAG: SOS response-associated peptidase [Bacteroidales bacterium]